MNRRARRELQRSLRKEKGFTKQEAKDYVSQNFMTYKYSKGDKVKIDYKKIVKHPIWKKQNADFREWVNAHKDMPLTIDGIFEGGHIFTFAEDESENKHKLRLELILPVASAVIKLDDGTEKTIMLEGITDTNDPKINEQINQALEDLEKEGE